MVEQTSQTSACITFEDNRLLPLLYGEQDKNLSKLEERLDVSISSRGNAVSISGKPEKVSISELILHDIYCKLENGIELEDAEVDATITLFSTETDNNGKSSKGNTLKAVDKNLFGKPQWKNMVIKTQKKQIVPFSASQAAYLEAMLHKDLTFACGPAGTGKTYFAVAIAAHLFLNHEIDRIILTRPAVEAGEKLGFLPGDMKEKVDPYLRPLYDALHDMMPSEKVQKHITNGDIEIAPLAFMRGRTLKHAFIILDEAQNTTPTQMKMFLTRMGEKSKMVVNGDLSQTDLAPYEQSGLKDAMHRLADIDEIATIEFTQDDIVRHALTAKIIQAYDEKTN